MGRGQNKDSSKREGKREILMRKLQVFDYRKTEMQAQDVKFLNRLLNLMFYDKYDINLMRFAEEESGF